MAEYHFGVASVEVGDFNPTTGLGENYTDIGKILRGRLNVSATAPTKNKIQTEIEDDPLEIIKTDGDENYQIGVLDTSAANLQKFLGGTTSGVAPAPLTWNKPDQTPNIILAFKFTLKSGQVIEVRRGDVTGTREWDGRIGAHIIALTIEPLNTKVADVAAVTITDVTPLA